MPIKKETKLKPVVKTAKVVSKKTSELSIPIFSLAGKMTGTLNLPKEIFGLTVNKKLLSQALRVYMTNQKNLSASTKTRGEVRGTTAKAWKQKGTGRARHGARTAPIFVGGGITFGPRPRNIRLNLPQKMKKVALNHALSSKQKEKQILGVTGLDKVIGKTKEVVKLLKNISERKSVLIVTDQKLDSMVRAVRNIPKVNIMPLNLLNAYEVLKHQKLLLTKETIEALGKKV